MTGDPFRNAALDYAAAGWEVFPLRGKTPWFKCPLNAAHKAGRRDEPCPGGCGNGGHGVLDATRDADRVSRWGETCPGANIGARVPPSLFVVDTDPRHGGEANLAALEAAQGPVPSTLTAFSGRGDGGRHRYFLHPGGKLVSTRLPDGIDIKTHAGYVVVPPSIHPASGKPYTWAQPLLAPVAAPGWLVKLVRAVQPSPVRQLRPVRASNADSIIDWFNDTHTWDDILGPAGWTVVRGGWCHPTATSSLSATERDESLYVYSPNTPFDQTEADAPHGYSRFRAWAVLCHGGDLRAAARAARGLRDDRRTA